MGLIKYIFSSLRCRSQCSINEELIPELVSVLQEQHGAELKDSELQQIHKIVRKGTERKLKQLEAKPSHK